MGYLQEFIKHFDPMREDNERYAPEDHATLQYAKVSIRADGKWVAVSLHPKHVTMEEMKRDSFVKQVLEDYASADSLELRIDCYEHVGGSIKRGLTNGEFSLICMGALDLHSVSVAVSRCQGGNCNEEEGFLSVGSLPCVLGV